MIVSAADMTVRGQLDFDFVEVTVLKIVALNKCRGTKTKLLVLDIAWSQFFADAR